MVKMNLLIGWGLIGCVDTTHNVVPRGGTTDVREFLVPKSLDHIVEVGGCIYREAPEEYGTRFMKQRLDEWFLGLYGFDEERESEGY